MERLAKRYIVLFIMVLCALFFLALSAKAEDRERVIRVGFPHQEGLTIKDEKGDYSGYTYDYLREVAQYTGWTYEFVEAEGTVDEQLIKLMDMLEKGEIDLLGAMNYSKQTSELYDFPSENYGNAYSVIAVRNDEDRVDEYNLPDYKNLRIALLRQADYHNGLFYQYAKLNGLDYNIVWCDQDEEQSAAVESGAADALLSIDLSLKDSFRSIARFSPRPFYFATTKGNTQIINELNHAIPYISETNPTLEADLYNKYFSRSSNRLLLSSQEKDYISSHPTLRILVHDGFGPMQYYDENGEIQGVAKDILSSIAQKAGWKLEFLYTDSYSEFEQALFKDEADVALSILYDYDTALKQSILLSNPYLETESVLVTHEGVDALMLDGRMEAVYRGVGNADEDHEHVRYYDSLEESLNAVEKGECDYTYSNSYTASYYQRKNRHQHTVIYPQAGNDSEKYSIGILEKNDKQLLSILNKGIRSIDTGELEAFIYNNAQQNQTVTLHSYIRDNSVSFLIFILAAVSFLLALAYFHYRSQMKMKRQIELENIRYRYLSDILREVTFSYDYSKDLLTLSQEGAEIFDTEGQIDHYSRYVSRIFAEKDMPSLYEMLDRKADVDDEFLLHLPGGEEVWHRMVIKVIFDGDQAISAIGRFQNIHHDKMERERLVEKSRLDGLTGICNIATAKKEIQSLLESTSGTAALAIIDLDGFKEINDRYGHYTGDQVLIQTAEALREVFNGNSIVGRLGGDEFIACVPYQSHTWLEERCHMLFGSLQHRCDSQGYPVVTVSMGIALSRPGDHYTSLYQRADTILYSVKNSGKNDFRIEEKM